MKKPRRAAEQNRVKAPTPNVVLWRPRVVLASRAEAGALALGEREPHLVAPALRARRCPARAAPVAHAAVRRGRHDGAPRGARRDDRAAPAPVEARACARFRCRPRAAAPRRRHVLTATVHRFAWGFGGPSGPRAF